MSRGELVAIGGSFRSHEILEASGAVLAEVGTTNRTSIEDYRRGLSQGAALLLTVHPSNYEIRGYTRRPEPGELAALAREAGIPWVHDQGTGCVEPLEEFGVPGEPTVASCLADGADIVTFSGDKLFGGPQAGFVAGRADLVSAIAAHPVARAVRLEKMALAALSASLAAWKTGAGEASDLPRGREHSPGPRRARREDPRGRRKERSSGSRLDVVNRPLSSAGNEPGETVPRARFPSRFPVTADDLAAKLPPPHPPSSPASRERASPRSALHPAGRRPGHHWKPSPASKENPRRNDPRRLARRCNPAPLSRRAGRRFLLPASEDSGGAPGGSTSPPPRLHALRPGPFQSHPTPKTGG